MTPVTVARLLGIDLQEEPARYDIGCEPAEPPPPRPQRRRAPPLDRRLVAPFVEAARAGVPDADLAKAAGVTVSQVRAWRLRLGIKRRPGTTTLARVHGALLTTPDLVRALLAFGRVDQPEPPPTKRFSYEELDAYCASTGTSMREVFRHTFKERSPGFARRRG